MSKLLEAYKFDDHIKECDYRYRKLEQAIDNMDEKLDKLEQLILSIKYSLKPEDYCSD